MPTINQIPNTAIPRIPIIKIPVEQSIPNTTHITRSLPPTLIMPCVTLRNDGTENSQLFIDDPSGNKLVCPLPYYVPLQYDKKKILLVEEQKAPTNVDPPKTDTEQPEVPKVDQDPPCPDPKKNNPRIGDLNAKGTEKVVGFKYIKETKECVVQYEPTTAVEKYLPSLNTVSTTFAITVVATTAATLTPILNKILKPLFKQAIGKVKKAIGKKGTKFSGKKPMKSKIKKV
tara:strand:- start:619 stop:1308 length:690 start_codon:yes stop_codon:yes gene_type:complete